MLLVDDFETFKDTDLDYATKACTLCLYDEAKARNRSMRGRIVGDSIEVTTNYRTQLASFAISFETIEEDVYADPTND
jgi:hypothetical protein